MDSFRIIFLAVCLWAKSAVAGVPPPAVLVGADVLVTDSAALIRGKRVGVVCNRASILSSGIHVLEAIRTRTAADITAVFAPEHGLEIDAEAGEAVVDDTTGAVAVFSLYGKTRKPTAAMLRSIDVLIVDLQDAGARFYTYLSTLVYCMEAAAENGIPVIVLDRPNPVGGVRMEGPMLDPASASFVGLLPVPVRHGMTLGELARMAVGERWGRFDGLVLHVIPMRGWRRTLYFDQTRLRWIPPSPNMRKSATALPYLATCFLEGTNISEGRGTEEPFWVCGAPFLPADTLAARCNALGLPGVRFEAAEFVPRARPEARDPKYRDRRCHGVRLGITDRRAFEPVRTGFALLRVLRETAPEEFRTTSYLDQLAGKPEVAATLQSPETAAALTDPGGAAMQSFALLRSRYLLYASD